jgi:tyrosine-protein phosphatase YwqE
MSHIIAIKIPPKREEIFSIYRTPACQAVTCIVATQHTRNTAYEQTYPNTVRTDANLPGLTIAYTDAFHPASNIAYIHAKLAALNDA